MAKKQRQPFSPSGEFIANKEFRFGGKTYLVGDSFPWRKLSCSMRRLIQLYEGRYVDVRGSEVTEEDLIEEDEGLENEVDSEVDSEDDTLAEEDSDESDEDEEDSTEDFDEDGEDETEGELFTFDPEIHEVISPARGEYEIRLDGEVLYSIDKKLSKKLKKVTKPTEIRIGE